jgi:hypothetical protein
MWKEIIRTSIFLSMLQKIQTQEHFITSRIYKIFTESQTYRLMVKFQEGTRVNFKYSFLGKMTEIDEGQNINILESSNTMKLLMGLSDKYKYKILNYFKASAISNSIDKLNKGFYLFPIKTASMIIIIAIITNIIISFFLKREIGLFGWFMRGIFLFMAINGLYSYTSWEELNKTSYFLKRLNNLCKI